MPRTRCTIGAIIDNTGMRRSSTRSIIFRAVSLFSAPDVTTQNGLKANIDIVQEFPYPTSFEKPKLSSNNLAYAGPRPILPWSWPFLPLPGSL